MISTSSQASKRTLAGSVYEALRSDILTCRIEPGSKIRINELCVQLGVNLGAVREALSKLSSEGLVTSEAQKGFRVAPVSRQELVDLTSTRVDLENLCLAEAISYGEVVWESQIVASLHHLSRLSERDQDDPARLSELWVVAHAAFHLAPRRRVQEHGQVAGACLTLRSERALSPIVGARQGTAEAGYPGRASVDRRRGPGTDVPTATRLMTHHLNNTTEILLAAPFLKE